MPPKPQKFDSLQVLRGISALLVLMYHSRYLAISKLGAPASFWKGFQFGHSGLHLFFVLSGFIMFYIHEKDLGKPRQLKPFVLKRAIRIYPVNWILTLAVVLAVCFFPESVESYKRNLWFVLQCLVLFPVKGLPIIPPAWSLSHELKFYCWFALAIYLPIRISRWIIGPLAAFSLGVYFLELTPATNWLIEKLSGYNFVFFLVHPYNLEFVAGSLCAYMLRRYSIRNGAAILGIGVLLFSVAAVFDDIGRLSVTWRILCYGISSAVVLLGAAAWNYQSCSSIFRHLVFLGEASYSLYLIHFPVCTAVCLLLLKSGVVKTVGFQISGLLLVFSSLFSAYLFHWLVEKRMLQAAHRCFLRQEKVL